MKIPDLSPKHYDWLKFEPIEHKYTDETGKVYTSVTTLIEKYKQNVFTDEFIESYAKERGLTAEYVKAIWKIKGDFAALKGTELHLFAECYLSDGTKIKTVTPIEHQKELIVNFWDRVKDSLEVVATEFRIASKKYGIAGTIDLLIYSKTTQKYHILDWKSNEKIEITGRNDLLPPLNKYQDCEFHKYSIQLGIYRYLLEEEFNCELGDSMILHLGSSLKQINKITCFYPKEEISKILLVG